MKNKLIAPESADFLHYLLSGNKQKCSAIAKQYLKENPSIKDLYEKVFKDALYEVGILWETNKISVATEHLATAITEGILNELYEEFDIQEQQNNKVVLTCVENELHQVGIKMVADVFEMKGWESYFLGTGIPISELVQFLKQEKPNVLAISMSIFFNYQNMLRMIEILKNEFPDLNIVVGGQGFVHKKESNFDKIDKVKYISSLYDLESYLETF
jgi:methanogenic corrinoid protein MtbC1